MGKEIMVVEAVPRILPAPTGSEYFAVVEWRDSISDETKRFPLHSFSESKYAEMEANIFNAKVFYVGPFYSFPNEFVIKQLIGGMKQGMGAWFIYCVVPYPDQARPFRTFPIEIADIKHFIAISQVPEYFYRPELINEAMRYAWDRMG